jgi:hypothetical protein
VPAQLRNILVEQVDAVLEPHPLHSLSEKRQSSKFLLQRIINFKVPELWIRIQHFK